MGGYLTSHRSLVAILVVAALGVTSHAYAQATQPQGLFGGIERRGAPSTRLDLTASVVEGYDSDTPQDIRPSIDPFLVDFAGFSTTFSATAAYTWMGRYGQLIANGNSTLRRYEALNDTKNLGHGAGIGALIRAGRRTTLFANQTFQYSPTYFSTLFPVAYVDEPGTPGTPSALGVTAPDYAVSSASDLQSNAFATSVAISHEVSRHGVIRASGQFDYVNRLQETPLWQDLSSHGFGAEYSHRVRRNAWITGSGHYRSGEFGYDAGGKNTEVGFDIGASLARSLSPTRRIAFQFSGGAAKGTVPFVALGTFGGGVGTTDVNRLVGSVGFEYQFTRLWQVRANFRRGFEYVVDLPEPLFSDSFSFGLDGLLTRRLDMTVSGGYSTGESVQNPDGGGFDTYAATARLRYALSRGLATYGEYVYYYYDFFGQAQLRLGVPTGLERHAVRVGVALWIPTLGR